MFSSSSSSNVNPIGSNAIKGTALMMMTPLSLISIEDEMEIKKLDGNYYRCNL